MMYTNRFGIVLKIRATSDGATAEEATNDLDMLQAQNYKIVGQSSMTGSNGDEQIWWTLVK